MGLFTLAVQSAKPLWAGQSGFKLTGATSFVIVRRSFDIGKTALRAVFLLRSKSSFPPMCTGLKHGMM
jgi:hypothetical protein